MHDLGVVSQTAGLQSSFWVRPGLLGRKARRVRPMSALVLAGGDAPPMCDALVHTDASSATAPSSSAGKASRRPHKPDVIVGWDSRRASWLVANKLTLEVVPLPPAPAQRGAPGEFEILFDEAGFGVVASADWSSDLDDLLPTMVFEDDQGGLYFLSRDSQGGEVVQAKWELDLRFRYVEVTLSLEICNQACAVPAVVFERPRGDGSRILWDMLQGYKAMGRNMQGGQAWKWVHKCLLVWERLAQSGLGCVVRGAQVGVAATERDPERNICNTSVPTPLFIAWIARLCNASKQSGGVADQDKVHGLRRVLDALLSLVSGTCTSLPLFFDRWAQIPEFPLPATGSFLGNLIIAPDGACHIEDPCIIPAVMEPFFISTTLLPGPTHIRDLIISLADAQKGRQTFLQQVSLRLAAIIEAELLAEGNAKASICEADCAPAKGFDTRLDQKLLQHTLASKVATEHSSRCFSMAVDKSRVGSLGLHVAMGVLPTNQGFVMPPCVALGGGLWL